MIPLTHEDVYLCAAREILWQNFPGWPFVEYTLDQTKTARHQAKILLDSVGGPDVILQRTDDLDRQAWMEKMSTAVYELLYAPIKPDHVMEECDNLATHIVNAAMTGETRMDPADAFNYVQMSEKEQS